ncbi:MAG: acyl-CoA dehydrogenase family protein [Sphingomonas fennica]
MPFATPAADMLFCHRVAGGHEAETLGELLDAAARFAEEVLLPLNPVADKVGASYANGIVTTPPGFADAYARWAEGGWNGVDTPEAAGGMGLPVTVGAPLMELWTSACMALLLCPVIGQGSVEVLLAHGSEELKAAWIPPLVSGKHAACMSLTEPQAGSDLGQVRTRAERMADGRYRISGTKIFITYGDHDLTPNIVHMVLARLPDAPAGSRGLSLFLVPKLLDGAPNGIRCTGIEHKMGIHGAPTCSISYGEGGEGSIGWLVGAENGGLKAMFTLMNRARLATGLQGVAVAERAVQEAIAYAAERRQGRAGGGGAIAGHPDVRRMLADMRATTLALRLIAYTAAVAIHADEAGEAGAADRAALLTPIVKAYCSDQAFRVASTAMQVFGGMGYSEESPVAQYLRDVRVTSIYEGTNGIQAIDLVQRKIVMQGGGAIRVLLAELAADADAAAACHAVADVAPLLGDAVAATTALVDWLTDPATTDEDRLAGATATLDLVGRVLGAGLLLRGATADVEGAPADIAALARFHAVNVLGVVPALADQVRRSAAVLPGIAA